MSSVYSNNLEATNQVLVSGYAVTSGVLAGLNPAVATAALASGNAALVLASSAQASGNAALVVGATAQSSGNAALVVGNQALASGNAALAIGGPSASAGVTTTFTAGSSIVSGYAVGLDANGRAVSVNKAGTDSLSVFATNFFSNTQVQTGKDSVAYIESQNTWLFGYWAVAGSANNSGVIQCAQVSGTSLVFGAATPVLRGQASQSNSTSVNPKVYYLPGKDRGIVHAPDGGRTPSAVAVSVSNLTPSFGGTIKTINSTEYDIAAGVNVNNDTSPVLFTNGNTNYTVNVVSISGSTSAVSGQAVAYTPKYWATVARNVDCGTYCHDRIRNQGVFVGIANSSGGFAGQMIPITNTSTLATPALNNTAGAQLITSSGIHNICASVDYKNNGALVAYVNGAGSGIVGNYNPGYGEAIYLKFVGDSPGVFAVPSAPVVFNSASTFTIGSTYDNFNNRFVLAWTDGTNLKASQVLVTSGNSLQVGTPTTMLTRVLNGSGFVGVGCSHASGTPYTLVTYGDGSTTASGFACVLSGTAARFLPVDSTLRSNVIGVAQTSATSGGTVTVALPGSISRIHSGLTPGKYVYPNYTTSGITTTSTIPEGWGQDPFWNPIGVAISSTEAAIINPILPQ